MKQVILKRFLIVAIAFLTAPAVFSQKEKEKIKEDKKEEMQTIVITRNGNTDHKTTIEIDGDKVKINGKDATNNKDVQVNVNTIKSINGRTKLHNFMPGASAWNFNMDGNQMSLLSEDSNRAMLGVTTEENDKGAEIQLVSKESAAEKAGLKKGDVITMIGNKKIENADDVTKAVRAHKPGEKVSITFLRDGKEQKTTAELTKWKGIKMNTMAVPRFKGFGQLDDLNQRMKELNIDNFEFKGNFNSGRPKLGLSVQDTENGIGVKVLDVDEESAAEKAGIKKDDIILGVDDTDVKETDDIVRATRNDKSKTSYKFKVKRGSSTQTIEVKVPHKLKTADL